jgi:indole-3-glycerol phosphate synthase
MSSILDRIISTKKQEVIVLKKDLSRLTGRTQEHRPFVQAISQPGTLSIIAEVKKASPSKGIISKDFDPQRIAIQYFEGGATAMSVLTDEKYFMGSRAYLEAARKEVPLPVLRKDFIIDLVQVQETVSMNADAMLLIASCLAGSQMDELYCAARECGLDVLLEIHNGKELDRAMNMSHVPQCIGINNRNLGTFTTDIGISLDLAPNIPKDITIVSESGIENRDQATLLFKAGVSALLVGESLMRSNNVEELIKDLTNI